MLYKLLKAMTFKELKELLNTANDNDKIKIVNGEIMLVKDNPIECKFNVGDKAIINKSVCFVQVSGDYILVDEGTEVEIVSISDCISDTEKLYEIKCQYATAVVKECVLIPVEPKPIKFKFDIGDNVTFKGTIKIYTIIDRFVTGKDCPTYKLEGCESVKEDCLELYIPQDITERIKTFDDACKWCVENGKREMLHTYSLIFNDLLNSESEITEDAEDIIAYLKLRIITCALNEGWEPKFTEDEERCHIIYDVEDDSYDFGYSLKWETAPNKLIFKSEKLAAYAAKQFFDIYADFCGCKKSDNQQIDRQTNR